MPIISVKLAKGRSIEEKQNFVAAITVEASKHLNVKEEWVTVLFEEFDRNATNGELHELRFRE